MAARTPVIATPSGDMPRTDTAALESCSPNPHPPRCACRSHGTPMTAWIRTEDNWLAAIDLLPRLNRSTRRIAGLSPQTDIASASTPPSEAMRRALRLGAKPKRAESSGLSPLAGFWIRCEGYFAGFVAGSHLSPASLSLLLYCRILLVAAET